MHPFYCSLLGRIMHGRGSESIRFRNHNDGQARRRQEAKPRGQVAKPQYIHII